MAHEPFMDESWEAAKRGLSSLIQPPGTLEGQTFVGEFETKRCSLEIMFSLLNRWQPKIYLRFPSRWDLLAVLLQISEMTLFAVMGSSHEVWKDLRMMRSSALWKGFLERLFVVWCRLAEFCLTFCGFCMDEILLSLAVRPETICGESQMTAMRRRAVPEAVGSWKTSFPSWTASFEGLCMTMIDFKCIPRCTCWFLGHGTMDVPSRDNFFQPGALARHWQWLFGRLWWHGGMDRGNLRVPHPMPTPSHPPENMALYGLVRGLLRDLLPVPTRPICRCNLMSAVRTTRIMCVAQHCFAVWVGWVGILGSLWSKNLFHIIYKRMPGIQTINPNQSTIKLNSCWWPITEFDQWIAWR